MADLPPMPPPTIPPPPPVNGSAGITNNGAGPAPLGRRFGALAIDLVLAAVTAFGLGILARNGVMKFFNTLGTANDPENYHTESMIDVGVLLPIALIIGGIWLISLLVLWGEGTSPGKKMLGLYVVDARTGRRAERGDMVLRDVVGKGVIGAILMGFPLAIGVLMILVMPSRRAYWDFLPGTVVVSEMKKMGDDISTDAT